MSTEQKMECRHFASYTGVSLPLNLITPLDDSDVDRRITYFRGYYDDRSRLVALEKVVYGEIEFEHRYAYHDNGVLRCAEIDTEDETHVAEFDEQGAKL